MPARIKQLESSLLDLGSEVFKIKHQLAQVAEDNNVLQTILKNLKTVLDEKGLIAVDDFETHIEVRNHARITKQPLESDDEFQIRQIKKAVH